VVDGYYVVSMRLAKEMTDDMLFLLLVNLKVLSTRTSRETSRNQRHFNSNHEM